ncbi:MAG TPA: POTRA domain-containing protein, partial [Candidatus Kryptonia bacterium]|nr:POTRA domain-containing protein [Candidatus Kryptonia bacterium]
MRVELVGAFALLALASATGAQVGDELVGRRIEAVEFHCVAPIDVDDLRRIVPVHVGDILGANDLERMRARLQQRDIFTAIDVAAEPRGADAVAIVATLVRKAIVNSVRFRGNHALRDSALERFVRLSPGSPFSDELRQFAEQRIRERYATEGFDRAEVRAELSERAPGEVDVRFRITEGEPVRVGTIEFDGELPIPEEKLRRAAGIKIGARYLRSARRSAEKAVARALRQEGYYEAEVDSHWQGGEDRRGTLRFHVDAGPLVSLRIAGNRHMSERRILKLIDLLGRQIVTDGTWRELARRTRRSYQEQGYYFAKVDIHIETGVQKTVRLDVDEGPSLRVAEVSFDGNTGFSAAELREAMQTGPPSWIPWRRGVLLDDVLDNDLKGLWYMYRRRGFESADIVDVRTRYEREQGKIFITVVIEEGPRTTVTAVEHEGFAGISALPRPQVRPGVPLNPDDVEGDRRALLSAQRHAGYPQADVSAKVSSEPREDGRSATVRFTATPGKAARIGAVIVQNNLDTKSRVVLRELTFKPGDPLDPETLLRSQTRLYRLGLFRTVDVHPLEQPANDGERDVAVTVLEKAPGSLQLGGGYNTRDGLRGFFDLSNNNLEGLARRLSLHGEMSLDPSGFEPNEYLGDLGYRDPRFYDSLWTVRGDLIAQRSTRSVDQFSVERFAFVPALEYALSPEVRIGSDLLIEQSQVFDVAQDVLLFNPRDEGRLRTVAVGPFVVYEGRDDPFVPRRGTFDSLRIRYAPEPFGSDVPLIRIQGQHSQYIPLTDALTFIYVARAGWGRATEKNDQVPIRDRFFLGGR